MTILKYVFINVVIILTMTIIALEMEFETITFMFIYGIVGLSVYFLLMHLKFIRPISSLTTILAFIMTILTSILSTYILTTSIILKETDLAYSKITSIPKDRLIEYYKTKDLNVIPENKRRTWIGVLYREIEIVDRNRSGRINAVGWKGNSVFAYYNITENVFSASYH